MGQGEPYGMGGERPPPATAEEVRAALAEPAYDPRTVERARALRVHDPFGMAGMRDFGADGAPPRGPCSALTGTDDPMMFVRREDGTRTVHPGLLAVLDEVRTGAGAKVELAFGAVVLRYPCVRGRARLDPPLVIGAVGATAVTLRVLDAGNAPLPDAPIVAGGRRLAQPLGDALLAGNYEPFELPLPDPGRAGRVVRYAGGRMSVVG